MLGFMLSLVTLSSCDNVKEFFGAKGETEVVDSCDLSAAVEDASNPTFESIEDILIYQGEYLEQQKTDSIFYSLTEAQITNVVTVLDKKNIPFTKRAIVDEYTYGKDIYDNLPSYKSQQTNTSKDVDLSATDLGNRSGENVISETTNYRMDTVNGKQRKIKITKKESYESN